jgi:predicted phosphoribosyltransferase
MLFTDRQDAGRQLAERLLTLKENSSVVLAVPRGGVPVAFEIACALRAPLDLVLVRKIGSPNDEELAVGAIADGDDPELVGRVVVELAHCSVSMVMRGSAMWTTYEVATTGTVALMSRQRAQHALRLL